VIDPVRSTPGIERGSPNRMATNADSNPQTRHVARHSYLGPWLFYIEGQMNPVLPWLTVVSGNAPLISACPTRAWTFRQEIESACVPMVARKKMQIVGQSICVDFDTRMGATVRDPHGHSRTVIDCNRDRSGAPVPRAGHHRVARRRDIRWGAALYRPCAPEGAEISCVAARFFDPYHGLLPIA